MTIFPRPIAKFTAVILFAVSSVAFCYSALGQEYTAKDSAIFQKALTKKLSDFDRIDYQLKLAEYSIRKPGSYKADLDNASMWIERSIEINARLKSGETEGHILFEESYLDQERGPSPKGKELCEAAIRLLKNGRDKCLLATAYKGLAYYYGMDTHPALTTKIALINQSVTCYKQCGDKVKTAATLQYLADLYTILPDYALALKTVNESLAIFTSIHYQKLQGVYDLFGDVYGYQDDFGNAVKYELMALKTNELLKDTTMQACEINNHLGLLMVQLHQTEKAIGYFKAAQIIAEKNKDINTVFLISSHIADSYNSLNKPEEALKVLDNISAVYGAAPLTEMIKVKTACSYVTTLSHLKRFDRVRTYTEQLLNFTKSPTILNASLNIIYSTLINYYFSTKNYQQELIFLAKNQKILDFWNVPSRKLDNLEAWYKLDSARNDYKAAFVHLSKYRRLEDSVFTEKKSQQISKLQVENESQKKESEIRLKNQDIHILTQDAKIDKDKLKGAQLTRNVTLGGIMAFILLTGTQYRRYREKQKANLLITEKNTALQKLVTEKEWLLKEVHHRVKNNLHTVICLLESQASFLENDALKAIESSQHRIFAMSLIHQRLYQSTDIQTIDMANYLPEFIMYLKDSFGPSLISFQQEIESIKLDVSQAIPLALIVNEAVTNAIKYAFPGGRPGIIKIVLFRERDSICLSVADNGIGISGGIEPDEITSLGLELIRGLTEDLKGEVKFWVKNGTNVTVSFKKGLFNSLS